MPATKVQTPRTVGLMRESPEPAATSRDRELSQLDVVQLRAAFLAEGAQRFTDLVVVHQLASSK
jgi:hypothetical protein